MRSLPLTAGLLVALAAATSVMGQSSVLGNSLAATCSRLALAGLSDSDTLDVCTTALREEFLPPEAAAKTHVNRGIIHLRRAALDRAAGDFANAERLMPGLGEIYVNRAVILMKRGQWADAVRELDRGIALRPEQVEKAYFNRGIARENLDDVRGAYEDYRKAAELAPEWDAPKKELSRFRVTGG